MKVFTVIVCCFLSQLSFGQINNFTDVENLLGVSYTLVEKSLYAKDFKLVDTKLKDGELKASFHKRTAEYYYAIICKVNDDKVQAFVYGSSDNLNLSNLYSSIPLWGFDDVGFMFDEIPYGAEKIYSKDDFLCLVFNQENGISFRFIKDKNN